MLVLLITRALTYLSIGTKSALHEGLRAVVRDEVAKSLEGKILTAEQVREEVKQAVQPMRDELTGHLRSEEAELRSLNRNINETNTSQRRENDQLWAAVDDLRSRVS